VTALADPNDSTAFRRVLSRFPSGLVILATRFEDKHYGVTCQAFTSVSLDPPLVGAFLQNDSGSLWAIRQAGHFTVSVLAQDQTDLARVFSISGADKFRDVTLGVSPSGLPIISNALAWMECDVRECFDAGDHTGVLGLVTAMSAERDSKPVVYWRGGYGEFR
jgi:3-hydroxy-9,10-secoandrosta-1,3,5(10)-triene-9,17-dione monooxygenase reductase component